MTAKDVFLKIKADSISDTLEITNVDEAIYLHDKVFIPFRVKLIESGLNGFMPHYRGEQKYGWDIIPGVFRPPLTSLSNIDGKKQEKLATIEFENTIKNNIGDHALRQLFNAEK